MGQTNGNGGSNCHADDEWLMLVKPLCKTTFIKVGALEVKKGRLPLIIH